MAKEKKKPTEKDKRLKVEWNIPDYIFTRFASNLVVQSMENEFKISFFELKPEIQIDPTQPPPSKIKADCVASIIVTPPRLAKFIEVLQRQLDIYNNKIKSQK